MKKLQAAACCNLSLVVMMSFFVFGYSGLVAMDDSNIYDMYEAAQSPSAESDNSDKDADLFNRDYGILHKSVSHSRNEDNHISLNFFRKGDDEQRMSDEEISNFSLEQQRLKRKMEYIGKVIEGNNKKSPKHHKSSLLEPLAQNVVHYDLYLDGSVHPTTGKTEIHGLIHVAKRDDIEDDVVMADVEKILEQLENDFNIEEIKVRLFDISQDE